ncbi:MAG: hypothetical protein NPMRTH1_820015 [Nitrosopumilales archaeon]|nr:MAG: hypothetical protein NPMRTH1_820015 [Nitrosopumilales archaeon]
MIISNDITDAFEYLAFTAVFIKSLEDYLSDEKNIDEKTFSKNFKVTVNAINFNFNSYHKSRMKYSETIKDIVSQIITLESSFFETMDLLSPLSTAKITKLQTIIGSLQELILSKIPKNSKEYKHLQKEFPGKL